MSATNTFLRHNSLVYAQKSSLKWPILINLLCLRYFRPNLTENQQNFRFLIFDEKSIDSMDFHPIGLKFGMGHLCMALQKMLCTVF
mgnify:CR=1 FL=1